MGQPRPLFVYFRTFQTSRCLSILFVCCGPFSTNKPLSSFSISLFLFHLTCNGKKNKKRKTARASLFNGKKLFWNFFSKTSRLIVNHAPILDPTAVEFFLKFFDLLAAAARPLRLEEF